MQVEVHHNTDKEKRHTLSTSNKNQQNHQRMGKQLGCLQMCNLQWLVVLKG
jgi:hypothetical protein